MGCFGNLCGLKIVKSSSNRNITNASPVRTVRTALPSKYSENLISYASACQEDSNLKSSDYMLYQRTTRVINLLAAQTESQYISLDSLMEVYGFVLELNQDAVRVIIESKEDVWKNEDLKSLVEVYFQSTAKTLDFFSTVQNCIKRAENMQEIIRFAVKQFQIESDDTDQLEGNKKNKYSKTLEELNKFKAVGDTFGDDFMTQYESVHEQHVLLLDTYRNLKVKLDKKQKNVKIWRTLSNVVFRTLFLSNLVLSVLAAMNVVPVVAAVASSLATPFGSVGKWFSETWKAYEEAVGRQRGLAVSLEKRTRFNSVMAMTIRDQLESLHARLSLILDSVDFAVERNEDEIATRLALQEIMKKVEEFTKKIQVFGANMTNCSKFIVSGRLQVLKHIVKLPAN